MHSLSSTLIEEVGQYVYFYTNENDVELKPLLMDLYTPKGDTEKKRAAVIVSHGGAFVAGAKDDTDQQTVTYCDSLAARGFVAASIEYRMGVTLAGSGINYSIDSVDFVIIIDLLRFVAIGYGDVQTIPCIDLFEISVQSVEPYINEAGPLRISTELIAWSSISMPCSSPHCCPS